MNTDNLISLQSVSKIYGHGETEVRALDDINLDICRGEFTAITGHSGSGKSTMMNILGCLDTPDKGKYLLCGRNTANLRESELNHIRNHMIGFVFQGFNLIPTMTAMENVELPLIYRGINRIDRRRMAIDALDSVGLIKRRNHLPCQMSGGQCQRVAIARAIASRPSVILADEPTGNLDSTSGNEITQTLFELWNEGHTIILITHDNSLAQQAERIVQVSDGKIISDEHTKKSPLHCQ